MVSFSIKPGDQTDEIQSPNLNLVNKTELKGEYQSSFYKVFWEIQTEGVY